MPTKHALRTILDKGFNADAVKAVHRSPERVTAVRAHPGQIRLIGRGLALVGEVRGKDFVLMTVYLDGVLTPPRPDQMSTPEGQRYAQRFNSGLGRG